MEVSVIWLRKVDMESVGSEDDVVFIFNFRNFVVDI